MTRPTFALVFTAVVFGTACSERPGADRAQPTAPVTSEAGVVVVPSNSPMLSQLTREAVAFADLPTDEVVAPGKIEANPNRVSKVVLPLPGRITSVLVRAGDSVKKDQPLLTIESPDADAAMSGYLTAEASVTQAQVALTKSQADFDRATDLFEHNAVAKKDVLSSEAGLAQARAALEQARASREQTRRRLTVLGLEPGRFDQPVTVRAPLAGKVLELTAVPGEFRNDANAPLLTIADLTSVWVASQVPESYIRFVQMGERLETTLVAYPGQVFEGHVSRIADTVDPQTRTVKVQAEMNNPDGRLRPEMYGSIHHIESTAPILVVASGAIVQRGHRTVAFVETAPGRFVERTIVTGRPAGQVTRVVSGLSAGDRVVTDGAMLLAGLVQGS